MSTQKNRVCVVGAAGRMGRRLVSLIREDSSFEIAPSLDREVLEQVVMAADPRAAVEGADLVIDFSAPPSCETLAPICAELGKPYIVASTGLSEAAKAALDLASKRTAILESANFSIGVNVLLELVESAARRLGGSFDIEISEIHHRNKRDAPSGTAHALAGAAGRGRQGLSPVLGRAGVSEARSSQEVGVAALRGGDVSGEHSVYFLGMGERLELTHLATTPDIFARGALRAAAWLRDKSPGRYEMRDLLGDAARG